MQDIQNMESVPVTSAESAIKESHQSLNNLEPRYSQALSRVQSYIPQGSITIELPILRKSVQVEPLKGREDEDINTLATDSNTFLNELNIYLYNKTTYPDKPDYETWLTELYPQDKSMLIYALLAATYTKVKTINKVCPDCNQEHEFNFKTKDILKPDGLPKAWNKRTRPSLFVKKVQIMDFIIIEYGLPNEKDRLDLEKNQGMFKTVKNIEEDGKVFTAIANIVLFIKKITIKGDQNNPEIILEDKLQDIQPFLLNLDPNIKDLVKEKIDLGIFEEYMPEFYEDTVCPNEKCKKKEKVSIIPEVEFFLKALSV